MRLVESVVEVGDGVVVCEGRVAADHPLAAEGAVPAVLGLELAAQAAAVVEALSRRGVTGSPVEPRRGYLVSVRGARLRAPTFPAGALLRATVRAAGRAGPLAMWEAVVDVEGEEHLTATLGTYAVAEVEDG